MTNAFEDLPGVDTPGVDTTRLYELMVDGRRIGFIEYSLYGCVAIVTHTEIDPRCEGRGYGSELARQASAFFRSEGWQVVPVCGFFARYLRAHPEDAQLLTPASRRIFAM
jgi:predicted GNAT family acetyltransferase